MIDSYVIVIPAGRQVDTPQLVPSNSYLVTRTS